jgi:hypothetical protein
MPIETKNLEPNQVGLIGQSEDGGIYQIGLTEGQSRMLQFLIASISKEQPLVKMGPDHDLVLKRTICKKCQNK